MRIRHLDCGTDCPLGGALFDGRSLGPLVCHCLLVETEQGLVRVDTGYGLRTSPTPGFRPLISRAISAMLDIRLREEESR